MAQDKRPTLRQVAARAGVSRTTVTRVLRGDQYVSDDVRARVEKAARALGYHRNPAVSTLMSHIRSRNVAGYRGKIAFFNTGPERDSMEKISWLRALYRGVRARAETLGYLVDGIWLNDPKLTGRRITNMLQSRGVQGVILYSRHPQFAELEWARFACAGMGNDPPVANMHYAGPDLTAAMHEAFAKLLERGYRRIGLMVHAVHDRSTSGVERGAYLADTADLPPLRRVPVLMLGEKSRPVDHMRQFGDWVRTRRPDAVLCTDENVVAWARELEIAVPDALGLAHLGRHPHLTDWAGIDQREEQIGAAAVDLVVGQLTRGELGLPPFQKKVLINGQWVEGTTVRPAAGP